MYDQDEERTAIGIVPVEGRGSMPFALLHGESLVAVASWALGESGVELLDFTESWADIQARAADLVVHDPLCPATPVDFLAEAVEAAASGGGAVVVGVRPVTDTVKEASPAPTGDAVGETIGETVDRAGLVAVASPVVIPAAVVAELPEPPPLDDLADLVEALGARHQVRYLEAPALARRVADESDLRLLEGLAAPR